MKLSTKGRYAMIALVDICLNNNGRLVNLNEIAKRQNISLSYLEQLFLKLRRAKIVVSTRGPGGGYEIFKSPNELRISDILCAVDEDMNALTLGGGASPMNDESKAYKLTAPLWEQLSANVYVFLHQTRLSDIVFEQLTPCPAVPALVKMIDE